MRYSALLIGSFVLSGVSAQDGGLGAPIVDPNLWGGSALWNVQDVATQASGFVANAMLGAVYNPELRETYVASRRDTSNPSGPHLVFVFDADGQLTATVTQHVNQNGSGWGCRDMAWNKDRQNPTFYLAGGDPFGRVPGAPPEIYRFDGTTIDPGPLTLLEYPHDVARAVAYCKDPSQEINGGADYFAVTDWSGVVSLHNAQDGEFIADVPSFQESCFGLAWNPVRDTLIGHGQGPETAHPRTSGSVMSEARILVDNSGAEPEYSIEPTDVMYFGDLSLSLTNGAPPVRYAGGLAGGLSGWVDDAGRYHALALQQATSDVVFHHDAQFQYGTCTGAGFNGEIGLSARAYETQPELAVTLKGADPAATDAVLLFGLPQFTGVPTPLTTCPLHVDILGVFPGVTLNAGAGQISPFPIPDGTLGVQVAFQWIVVGGGLPFDLSDAGLMYVGTK